MNNTYSVTGIENFSSDLNAIKSIVEEEGTFDTLTTGVFTATTASVTSTLITPLLNTQQVSLVNSPNSDVLTPSDITVKDIVDVTVPTSKITKTEIKVSKTTGDTKINYNLVKCEDTGTNYTEMNTTQITSTDGTDTSYMTKDSLHSKYLYPYHVNYQTNDIYLKGTDHNGNSMTLTSKNLINTYMSKINTFGTITITDPGPATPQITVAGFSGTLFNPSNKKIYNWSITSELLNLNTTLGANSYAIIKYNVGTDSAILAQETATLFNQFTVINLGIIIHPGGTIVAVLPSNKKQLSTDTLMNSFQDYINKFQKTFYPYGLNYYGNAINRRIGRTSGSVFAIGENYGTDPTEPNSLSVGVYDPVSFYYSYRLVPAPANDSQYFISPTPTLIDIPLQWDNGSGVLQSCSVAKYYIGMYYYNPRTPSPNGNNAYIYPQTEYASLDSARVALTEGTYNPLTPSTINTFWIRTAICFRGNVTNFGTANVNVRTVQYTSGASIQVQMSCNHAALSNLSYDLSGHTEFQRITYNQTSNPLVTSGVEPGNLWINNTSTPPNIFTNLTGVLTNYNWYRFITEDPSTFISVLRNVNNLVSDITIGIGTNNLTETDTRLLIQKRGENPYTSGHYLNGLSTWYKIGSYTGTVAASRTCWFEVFTGGQTGSQYANSQEVLHSFKSGDPSPFYTMHWQKGSSILSGTTAPIIRMYYDTPTYKIYVKTAAVGFTFIQFKNNELINNPMTSHGTGANPNDATLINYDTSDTVNYPPNSGIYCGRFASYESSTKYVQSNTSTSTFTVSLDTTNINGTLLNVNSGYLNCPSTSLVLGSSSTALVSTSKLFSSTKYTSFPFSKGYTFSSTGTWYLIGQHSTPTTGSARGTVFKVLTTSDAIQDQSILVFSENLKQTVGPYFKHHWEGSSSYSTDSAIIKCYVDANVCYILVKTHASAATTIQWLDSKLADITLVTYGTGASPTGFTTLVYDTSDATNYPPNDGFYTGDLMSLQTGTKYFRSNPATSTLSSNLDNNNFSGTNTTFSGTNLYLHPTNLYQRVRRQGGSANLFDAAGTTNYNETNMFTQIMVGTKTIAKSSENPDGLGNGKSKLTMTFPVAYATNGAFTLASLETSGNPPLPVTHYNASTTGSKTDIVFVNQNDVNYDYTVKLIVWGN